MKTELTPGNWRPGKEPIPNMPPTTVVSDCKCDHLFPCCPKIHGGHVVARGIDPGDVRLIAAAKELRALLAKFITFTECLHKMQPPASLPRGMNHTYARAAKLLGVIDQAAIAKAEPSNEPPKGDDDAE